MFIVRSHVVISQAPSERHASGSSPRICCVRCRLARASRKRVSHNFTLSFDEAEDTRRSLAYDPVGNLTFINYPTNSDVQLQYDALDRLTTMIDLRLDLKN
jgi:YD repeat-containing protein